MRLARVMLLVVSWALTAAAAPGVATAQIPTEFRNLKVLPVDIASDSLVLLMRSFSFATGLRCEGCHVMGEGGSFRGARFDLDDKENKRKARFMLRMVNRLNEEILPELPDRDSPPLAVECKTCHRRLAKPFLLRTELHRIVDREGIDAAVARYRELRETRIGQGTYDFGEWEMNELGRELEKDGNVPAAIAMLELNEEFHGGSSAIPLSLGQLYEKQGRRDDAIAAYRRVLERNPASPTAKERLAALGGG
jgi:tetratricopeptide (TPR) repeat protein